MKNKKVFALFWCLIFILNHYTVAKTLIGSTIIIANGPGPMDANNDLVFLKERNYSDISNRE